MTLTGDKGVTEVTLETNLPENTTMNVPAASIGICVFIRSVNESDLQRRTGFIVDNIDSILREFYKG